MHLVQLFGYVKGSGANLGYAELVAFLGPGVLHRVLQPEPSMASRRGRRRHEQHASILARALPDPRRQQNLGVETRGIDFRRLDLEALATLC
jgi:hypothetical protein